MTGSLRDRHEPPDAFGGKRCTKCGRVKPVGEFGAERRNRCGLAAHCKTCCRLKNGRRRETEEARAKARAAYDTDAYRARKLAAFYRRHEAALAKQREYRATPMGRLVARRNSARYRLRRATTPEGRQAAEALVAAYDREIDRLKARRDREDRAA